MYEDLHAMASAWREVARISEWTGLSVTALIGMVLLFLYVPRLRQAAIAGAVGVVIAYGAVLHGAAIGRADTQAQWDDARAAAIKADQDRDSFIEDKLERIYGPELQRLARLAADNKARANDVESKNAKLLAATAAGSKAGDKARGACELGAVAARLRGSQGEVGKLPAR